MQCPRCRTENGEAAIRCSGCGAPIALGDEATGTPVDLSVPLDRRSTPREGATPPWGSLQPVPMDWEMAPPAEARSGTVRPPPSGAPRPRPRVSAPPAPDFNVEMQGDVILNRDEEGLYFRGDLSILRGSYNLYGNKFQITDGTFDFSASETLRPSLSIDAYTPHRSGEDGDKNIYLSLTWPYDHKEPRISLGSTTTPGLGVMMRAASSSRRVVIQPQT